MKDVSADYMDVAVPIQRGETRYIIYILDDRTTVQNLNTQLFQLILEALAFGLIISILLSFLLSKTMITPIERLTTGAERVAKGDLLPQDRGWRPRDEIGVLTGTFNNMARAAAGHHPGGGERAQQAGHPLPPHDRRPWWPSPGTGRSSSATPPPSGCSAGPSPVGGDEVTYDTLFGDIAALPSVLAVEQPGYLGRRAGDRRHHPGAAAGPLLQRERRRRHGGDPRRHRAAQDRGDAPGVRGQCVPRTAHPPDQHPQLRRGPWWTTPASCPPTQRKTSWAVILNESRPDDPTLSRICSPCPGSTRATASSSWPPSPSSRPSGTCTTPCCWTPSATATPFGWRSRRTCPTSSGTGSAFSR